jgi:hypothetical protein
MLAGLARLTTVILPLAVVVIGIVRVYSDRTIGSRASTRRFAFRLALVLGGATAAVAELFLAGLAGIDVGLRPEHYLWALPSALALGGAVALAGYAGYGILTLVPRATPVAIAGVIIVPVILVAVIAGLNSFASDLDWQAMGLQASRANTEIEERCQTITPRVDVVSVDYLPGTEGVQGLTIDLVLAAAAEVRFVAGGSVTANQVAWDVNWQVSDLFSMLKNPIVITPAQPATYRVAFKPRPSGDNMPKPGPWRAGIALTREDGAFYGCNVQFVVPALGTSAPLPGTATP